MQKVYIRKGIDNARFKPPVMDEPEANPDEPMPVDYSTNQRRFNALMITGIALPFLLYPFLGLLLLLTTDPAGRLLISRFVIWAIVGLMWLYARNAEVQKFILWPEQKYDPGFYAISVICLYLLVLVAGWFSLIPKLLGVHESSAALAKMILIMKQYPYLMYFSAITAGFTEEFIFRGYILTRLSLFFKNKHLPVISSALLFALIHVAYKTWQEVIFAFLLGLLFGYYYQKYRNLGVLIAVHALVDIIAFMVMKTHK